MAPAVPPRAQVRCAGCDRPDAASSVPRGWSYPASAARTTISLANSMPVAAGPARGPWSVESPHAAVEVVDRHLEEPPTEEREHRVAQIAVEHRHGAGTMPPVNRLPITRSAPCAQLCDEGPRSLEVVAVVGVGHDHVSDRAQRPIPPQQLPLRNPDRDVDHPGAGSPAARSLGAVVAAVVGDDDLPDDSEAPMARAPSGCRSARVSASLRHGSTTLGLDRWARPVAAVAGHVGIDHVGVPLMQQVRQGSAEPMSSALARSARRCAGPGRPRLPIDRAAASRAAALRRAGAT